MVRSVRVPLSGLVRGVGRMVVWPFHLVRSTARLATFPYRKANQVRRKRKLKKAERSARRAMDSFQRMSPFDQEQVKRARSMFD